MKKNRPYDKTVYQALSMVFQFGLNMAVPIAITTALGIWMDIRCKTGYVTVLMFFIGAVAGTQNVYRMARRIYGSCKGKKGKQD